ncbi:PIWI [Culex quinquefasciatus]|uniref:PIWI n=1 Tax=Culex quinquefasciatus TaxID=7176 RepID=B0X2E4_CULQU|nr:PIWI [Culex quinquefasciatus]|eukprot:XP_001863816.1 PIWI [Culex quinquefasciatus]
MEWDPVKWMGIMGKPVQLCASIQVIGNAKMFDGVMLFLPEKMPNTETILQSENEIDGHTFIIRLM